MESPKTVWSRRLGRGVGRGQSHALSTLVSGQTHCFIGSYSADSHHKALLSVLGEKKSNFGIAVL